jgi:hypothetical protein
MIVIIFHECKCGEKRENFSIILFVFIIIFCFSIMMKKRMPKPLLIIHQNPFKMFVWDVSAVKLLTWMRSWINLDHVEKFILRKWTVVIKIHSLASETQQRERKKVFCLPQRCVSIHYLLLSLRLSVRGWNRTLWWFLCSTSMK